MKGEMGGAYYVYGDVRNACKILAGSLKRRDISQKT
jgi:hypothetical protein